MGAGARGELTHEIQRLNTEFTEERRGHGERLLTAETRRETEKGTHCGDAEEYGERLLTAETRRSTE
jgi:hypothetical protein